MSFEIIALFVFVGIGISNTVYLSYCKLTGRPVKCLFFPPEWCQKVQSSPYSKTMGVPNSFAGLAMNIGILLFLIVHVRFGFVFWPVIALVVFGAMFSGYFLYVQARILRAFCTWCVLSAIEFLGMLVLVTVKFFGN